MPAQKQSRRPVKRGEALAIMPEALHAGPDALWWDFYTSIPENERAGAASDIAVVHIRGSLDHHAGYGDSYERIVSRVRRALSGEDAVEREMCRRRWDDESEPPVASPPCAVVLRIDSPGGVVSGLNECVFALRKLSKSAGIPLIAYVDELAASAAYALACACDEIFLPASAIAGSVGVISCMYDQVKADEAMGVNFVTITSGDRKADGHPHVPIEDAAISAEQNRVNRLAQQFFQLVADKRPLSKKQISGYEAGIFLGEEAVAAGLADDVLGWDELIDALSGAENSEEKSLAKPEASNAPLPERSAPMSLTALVALVKNTKAAIKAEKDPKKKAPLMAALSSYEASVEAYKKTKFKETTEVVETSEEAPDDDEEPKEESAETEGSAAAEGDDGDTDDDEDGGEEASASSHSASRALAELAQKTTGKRGHAAVGALAAMISDGQKALASVRQIEKERRQEKKQASITAALNARRITKHEAKTLAVKPSSFVESFLEMRPKAIINIDDDSAHVPDPNAKPGSGAGLSETVLASIDAAVMNAGAKDPKALRQQMIEAHEKRMRDASNGAGRF